jgi:HK97 family phage major capsid protein
MEFKTKSAEEIKAMSTEDLHVYYLAKEKDTSEKLEVRLKALEVEKDSKKFEELSAEVKAMKEEQFDAMKSALKEQGLIVEKLRNGQLTAGQIVDAEKSIEQVLKEQNENFKKTKADRHEFKFDVSMPRSHKAVGNMTFAANVTGTMPQALRLPGVNDIAEVSAVIYNLIPKLNVEGNTIEWVYEDAQEGAPASTAEGAVKNQIDNNFVVTSVALKKYTAYFTVSTEMLDDVNFMSTWLRNKLLVRLFVVINNAILNHTGSGNNLTGIISLATTWAAGTFALTVDNANNVDSLVVGLNQVKLAYQSTNNLAIIMHPSDVTALKLIKVSSTDKNYVMRLAEVGSTMILDGYPIIETTQITAGTFLIVDFGKMLLAQKSGMSVQVGLNGNDLINNTRTIVAEWRGQLIIENNDRTGIIKGTFATTNAALETA